MEILQYDFFRNALVGLIIIAIAASMIGTYIVTRRLVFISGGVTHACFGGLGLGYYLGVSPVLMATVFAVGGSLGVDWLAKRKARADSAIAVIWALGMALGILFIFLTEGYVPELNSFLFGNVLTITMTDLWVFLGFTLGLMLFYGVFYQRLVAVSFDSDFSRTRHLPVATLNTAMTVFVAIDIVLTIKMIGIMLLMSMLALPQMICELYTARYRTLLFSSALVSVVGGVGGLLLAYVAGVPASATIVLLLVAIYGVALAAKALACR